jgi:hypothetical protein
MKGIIYRGSFGLLIETDELFLPNYEGHRAGAGLQGSSPTGPTINF